jgi:hypothetical protein
MRVMVWLARLAVVAVAAAGIGAAPQPPEHPARIELRVEPEAAAPGQQVRVRLTLEPIAGIKINRYPKLTLSVAARAGVVPESQAALGQDSPPPPERTASNFFDEIALELPLKIDPAAGSGSYDLDATLTYYYCLSEQFCTRKREALRIPLRVE